MKRVQIKDLTAGMVVAKPVSNEGGMVLLSEGNKLTDSLIARLQKMELNAIYIEGVDPGAKTKDELLADLELRFSKTIDSKYMDIIKGIMKRRIEEVCK